jgi:hypothetical protein
MNETTTGNQGSADTQERRQGTTGATGSTSPNKNIAIGTIKKGADGVDRRWNGKKWVKVVAVGTVKKGKGDYDVRWNGNKWVKVKGSEGKYSQTTTTTTTPAPPPELPALSAEEQMMYDQQIGVAGQGYKNLEAQTAEQRGLLLQRYQDTLEAMKRGGYESGQQLREQLSEGGLGFSPMFLGKGMRDIAQQTANETARLTAERAAQEEAMTRQLDISRRERDAELERLRIQSLIDRSAKLRQGIAK